MDDVVKKAIERELIHKPKAGFTDKVMNRVFGLKTLRPYEPIISKPKWIALGILGVGLLFVLLAFHPEELSESNNLLLVEKVVQYFENMDWSSIQLFENSNLLLIASVSLVIFLLLFFDSIVSRKQ